MTKMHSILYKIFIQTARSFAQDSICKIVKADVIFQKDVAAMVSCDSFLDSLAHLHTYLVEQPAFRLSKQHQEHCQRWDG